MNIDRRTLLKCSGIAALLGLAGLPDVRAAKLRDASDFESPKKGKRWAMVIDPLKCLEQEDCTKCIDACHTTHNVPSLENKKHEIKWIWKESFEHAFPAMKNEFMVEKVKHAKFLVLCNHCDKPPCTKVCPTQATWKRESDGLVMMDWHRCIGCRYCVAACPYGSRSFNWVDPREHIDEINLDYPTRTKGVVEKCTFCEHRLARGLEPACVEACPHGAMTFGDLSDPNSEARKLLEEKFSIRRKVPLGTGPEVYYLVG